MNPLAYSGSSADQRVVRDTAIATIVDVVTDIIVLSFPVVLLREIRVDARQKFTLGLSLCLSILMVVVTIVRVAGSKIDRGEVDILWLAFWEQQEASIAVMVISLSAFRALFVAKSMNNPPRRPLRQSINDWRQRVERRRLGPTTNEQETQDIGMLPQVPGPTLSGMSSVIRRL